LAIIGKNMENNVILSAGCPDALGGCRDALAGCPDALGGCPDALSGCPDALGGCLLAYKRSNFEPWGSLILEAERRRVHITSCEELRRAWKTEEAEIRPTDEGTS